MYQTDQWNIMMLSVCKIKHIMFSIIMLFFTVCGMSLLFQEKGGGKDQNGYMEQILWGMCKTPALSCSFWPPYLNPYLVLGAKKQIVLLTSTNIILLITHFFSSLVCQVTPLSWSLLLLLHFGFWLGWIILWRCLDYTEEPAKNA